MSNRRASGLKANNDITFTFVVKTDNVGTSNDDQFTIPTASATYNYTVFWGDGSSDAVTSTLPQTHTYSIAGNYTISIEGQFGLIFFDNGGDRLKILEIKNWGVTLWSSFLRSFYGCSNLIVSATDAPDLSNVNSLREMFRNCPDVNSNFNNWDVSTITDVREMLSRVALYNQSFSNWDITNITDFTDFLSFNTSMSTANYDATLIGWEATLQAAYPNGVGYPISANRNPDFGTVKYTEGSAAETARQSLITNYLWAISDGGAIATSLPLASIISEYKFENNVLDFVGSNDGTATAITYAAGLVGQTGVLNGTTSSVLLPSNTIPNLPSFSFSILVKATDTLAQYRALAFSDNVGMPFIILRLNNGTAGRIGFYLNNNSVATEITTDAYDTTLWTHITGTAVENSNMKLYVNGTLINTASILNFTDLVAQNYIGTNRLANGQFFKGDLDCIALWDKELTEGEVALLAKEELAGTDINP